jgi:hypothetical protein
LLVVAGELQVEGGIFASYSEATRERIALGQVQEIKCLLGRGWTAAPPEVTNTLSGR